MFTVEESALLARMLRVLGWGLAVLMLGGSCYVGGHWLHHHQQHHHVTGAATRT